MKRTFLIVTLLVGLALGLSVVVGVAWHFMRKQTARTVPFAGLAADEQYVKSGFPKDDLVGEGVMWNDVGDGLLLGYRITGDEWRILGKDVKVELWVQNPGDKDVKFQSTARPDIGLGVKMKSEKGGDYKSGVVPINVPLLGEHRLLPPGHVLKVKEFTVSLVGPGSDASHFRGHFFLIDPGAYNFHCELELPGFSATSEGGKQLTPAAGEWTGKLMTRALTVMVIAPTQSAADAKAPVPVGAVAEVVRFDDTQRAADAKAPVPSANELEGAWRVVSVRNRRGEESPMPQGLSFRFEGGKLAVSQSNAVANPPGSRFHINPFATPKEIDITETRSDGQEETVQGIYRLDKGQLFITRDRKNPARRPNGFVTGVNSGIEVLTLERAP
jgi:uncharacterized protein (TIGR03067 family)